MNKHVALIDRETFLKITLAREVDASTTMLEQQRVYVISEQDAFDFLETSEYELVEEADDSGAPYPKKPKKPKK